MEDIQKSYLEYGKNRIFLIGDELKDLYLRDIRDGYFDLTESIKDYILHNNKFKWFISVSSSKEKISFFEKNKNKKGNLVLIESKYTDFNPPQHEDPIGLLDMDEKENSDTEEIPDITLDNSKQIFGVISILLEGNLMLAKKSVYL